VIYDNQNNHFNQSSELLNFKNDIEKDNYFKSYAENKVYWLKRNRYYHQSIINFLKSRIPPNSSVIEIGSATGDTLKALEPLTGVGIEHNPYLVRIAEEKYFFLRFINTDIESDNALDELIKENANFDFIILSDLIGTLDDIQKVFEKLKSISHSKTKVIVNYYNYFWNPPIKILEALKLKMKTGEKNWLYIEEIKNLLFLSGFNVCDSGNIILIPAYIPIISAFVNRYLARLPFIRRLCITGFVIAENKEIKTNIEDYSVTVLVPCRNEEGNIESIIERIPKFGKHTEIIFVEGNSADNTYAKIEEVIKSHPDVDIKLLKQTGKGKGDAVRKGFESAEGDILMILDADMTVDPEELPKFYNALKSGKGEFINGTRLVYQMDDRAMRRLNKLGNIFFSKMFSWLLSQRITDTLCGTKVLFRKDYIRIAGNRKYFGDFDPYGDFDLLFGASKLNMKIIEIPVRYKNRKYGDTNINRFRDGFLLLKMCFFAMRKLKLSRKK